MRKLLFVLLALLAATLAVRAEEPPALIDWFKPPAWLADQHPPRANATLLLYATVGSWDGTRILLAEDWAAVLSATRGSTIYDYRLRTVVVTGSHGETTAQPLGLKALWRLDELRAVADAATDSRTACAKETLLGVELPNQPFHGDAHVERSGNAISVVCGGRVVSSLELSEDVAVPATLWPTLVNAFDLHPRLAVELSSLKVAPTSISTTVGNGRLHEEFSLDGQQAISIPYPLGKGFHASPNMVFIDDAVEQLVDEYIGGQFANARPAPSVDRFPGFLGEMQLKAEELPRLVDRVRGAPGRPAPWMDLSDYYLMQDDPLAALSLASLAYSLPGGPDEERVKWWLDRLRETEVQGPQFFLKP